jgi:hypothetical protein
MKARLAVSLSLIVGLCAAGAPVFAHQGNTAYDTSKPVVLKGATVTKFVWANPHCFVMVDVKDDKGEVQHWVGEAGSPSSLGLIGWSKNSIQPGDSITVYVYQSKNGHTVGRLNKIVLPDGTELKDSALGDKDAG